MIRGLDVSVAQQRNGAPPDFSKIPAADAIGFVIVKSAEGTDYRDPDFVANRDNARAAGLIVGCYNVGHPEKGHDPREQAKIHFDACGGLGSNAGELPPTLDYEKPDVPNWTQYGLTAGAMCAWALAYLEEAETLWGCVPIFYSFPFFMRTMGVAAATDLALYRIWQADYARPKGWPSDGDRPIILPPWTDWSLWQDSGGSFYKLPNGAPCDANVFNGDAAALAAFCATSRV